MGTQLSQNGTVTRRFYSGSPFESKIGFCRALRSGNMLFVSGTAPIAEDGSPFATGNAELQAERCFEIAQNAIQNLGGNLQDVVRTRIFLVSENDWQAVGKVHAKFFGEFHPTSTMIVVSKLLNPDWLVEIEVDAIVSN